jgi:hypothetical protein
MVIKETTPNIRQFQYKLEACDDNYGTCLWARITLDCDNYTILAESDCGHYAYSWKATPDYESFIHLLCRLDKSYLLDKLSARYVFELAQSKKETIRNVLDCGYELPEDDIQSINDLDCYSEESFYNECDEILRFSNAKINDRFELISCVKKYPVSAISFVNVFCDVLQPVLREEERMKQKNGGTQV